MLKKAANYKLWVTVLALTGLMLGIALRIVPYFYQRSLWVDEAMLVSSVCTRGFKDLVASPLDWGQSAPIGYLYILEILSGIFGESNLIFRIWSLITAFGCLGLLYTMMRKCVSKHMALLFTAFFSLANRYIYYANEVKSYMSDNFFSLLALYLWQKYQEKKISLKWLVIAYSVIIWFSFSAVFFVAAVMMVECVSLLKNMKKNSKKDVIRNLGLCFLVLVSFGLNYFLWLSKTSSNAGEPEYWALLSFPLIPTSMKELNLVWLLLKEFVKYVPDFAAIVLVVCFALYLLSGVKNGDPLKICIPFCISFLLLLVASAIGFYPIQNRLVQTHCIFLFLFAAVIFDKIEKKSEHRKGRSAVVMGVYGLIFACMILTGKDGLLHLEPESNYRSGYEVEDNMRYLKEHMTEEDYVYVWNKTIPAYTYLDGYSHDYAVKADIWEPYEAEQTIYGQRISEFLNEEPFSYAYELDWGAIDEDASLISSHASVYLFTSKGEAGLQELISVLEESGSVVIVNENYDTKLYHYISD